MRSGLRAKIIAKNGKTVKHIAAEPQPTTNYHGAQPPSAATEESSQVDKISNDSSAETLQLIQLGNSFLDNSRESCNLFRRIASSAKSIANLLRGELRQQGAYPFGIFAGNMLAHPSGTYFLKVIWQCKHVEQ